MTAARPYLDASAIANSGRRVGKGVPLDGQALDDDIADRAFVC